MIIGNRCTRRVPRSLAYSKWSRHSRWPTPSTLTLAALECRSIAEPADRVGHRRVDCRGRAQQHISASLPRAGRASLSRSGLLHGFRICLGAGRHGSAAGRPLDIPVRFQSRHRNRTTEQWCLVGDAHRLRACAPASFYRRAVMPWGSAAIAAIALVWLVQRAVFPSG